MISSREPIVESPRVSGSALKGGEGNASPFMSKSEIDSADSEADLGRLSSLFMLRTSLGIPGRAGVGRVFCELLRSSCLICGSSVDERLLAVISLVGLGLERKRLRGISEAVQDGKSF